MIVTQEMADRRKAKRADEIACRVAFVFAGVVAVMAIVSSLTK